MKFTFLFFLLFPLFIQAQDCNLSSETDPYTKEKKLSTGFISLRGGSIIIDADNKEIDVMFSIQGADKCYDNTSTAEIYFEGLKSRTTSRNGGTMNCEGLFHFIFRNSRSTPVTLLKRMCTMKMTQIVFTGNDAKKTKTVLTVTPDIQAALMKQVNCLVEEARGLIK